MIGTMTPRRLRTPRTYSGCLGRWVISVQPLISRTAMISTPYCSSPIEKLMNSTRPEARDSLGFWRQSSWPEELFEVVWSAGSVFTVFAHHKSAALRTSADTQTALHEDQNPRPRFHGPDDFDARGHDALRKLTTR